MRVSGTAGPLEKAGELVPVPALAPGAAPDNGRLPSVLPGLPAPPALPGMGAAPALSLEPEPAVAPGPSTPTGSPGLSWSPSIEAPVGVLGAVGAPRCDLAC